MKQTLPRAVQHGWARYWSIDLHVHTPASNDAKDEDFGSAADIVRAARVANLDAIAITDHNTAAWCDRMSAAAAGEALIVLPGFELSTSEGHLLAIWEEGTPAHTLEDVLVSVGIPRSRFGDPAAIATKMMDDCAKEILAAGGIAIAAHIDKERGILAQPVQTRVNQLLGESAIAAFEFVLPDTPAKVEAKLQGHRSPALVQGSDTYSAVLSRHSLTAIGQRRTWVKAGRPDLCGIRYALDDPGLRATLDDPALNESHPMIESVRISGGFLAGTDVNLSPDLNCLLGGTGAGKSLALEAIRFALDQQVDGDVFSGIRDEVDSRLASALGDGTEVKVEVATKAGRYRIRRAFAQRGSKPLVDQDVDGDWVTIDRNPPSVITIAAYSQGEILEYARQPVGRVGLVDAHLDLSTLDARIARTEADLRTNAEKLIAARTKVHDLSEKASKVTELEERERDLSSLFTPELVEEQRLWTSERGELKSLSEQAESVSFARPTEPSQVSEKIADHRPHYERIRVAQIELRRVIDEAEASFKSRLAELRAIVGEVRAELEAEFKEVQAKLDGEVESLGGGSFKVLLRELESIQVVLGGARLAANELKTTAQPHLDALEAERETLLSELKRTRDERRNLRRARTQELNSKTAGLVKIDIPSSGDTSPFRLELDRIKVGSRVQDRVLDQLAKNVHPYSFARALWSGDPTKIGKLPQGVTAADISRLHANVADRDYWDRVLELQQVDVPDVLNVKFKKPESGDYASIENLSHGQKCTAILVILLADGNNPVLIDQPEDALHAPWIEDYLVSRLRELRGTRQYIFATRSSGLVVSADSEQLVTMRATSDRGEIEASGSLERHDLNRLALHHLEGGRIPFGRRARKLSSSIA